MTSLIRLIIHEEYMTAPMWRDAVLIPPQVGEILVLSFGHFKIRDLYHHSPALRELAPTEFSIGASMSIRIICDRYPSMTREERTYLRLNKSDLEKAGWLEVPEDEQFWIPPPQTRPTFG